MINSHAHLRNKGCLRFFIDFRQNLVISDRFRQMSPNSRDNVDVAVFWLHCYFWSICRHRFSGIIQWFQPELPRQIFIYPLQVFGPSDRPTYASADARYGFGHRSGTVTVRSFRCVESCWVIFSKGQKQKVDVYYAILWYIYIYIYICVWLYSDIYIYMILYDIILCISFSLLLIYICVCVLWLWLLLLWSVWLYMTLW